MGCGGRRESIFHDDDDRYKAVLVEGVKGNAKLPPDRRGFLEEAWEAEG
jgi:glutamate-1-semialdehyde aminotransferase